MVTGTFSPGVKRPGREVDHSPPPSAEIMNEWIYTSAPSICLGSKDRDNFTFTVGLGLTPTHPKI